MARIFQIAVALEWATCVSEKRREPAEDQVRSATNGQVPGSGILLIDEIENGIHYSVLPELWRFLIKVAKLRDLQVLWCDALVGLRRGLSVRGAKEQDTDAVLIRLEKKGDANRAVIFAGEELPIVTRHGIEVR